MALLFAGAASLQLNDPDPLYWVAVYLSVALFPAAKVFHWRWSKAWLVTVGLVAAGLLMSGQGFLSYLGSGEYASIFGSMSLAKFYVEPAREFLGLALAMLCMFVYRK